MRLKEIFQPALLESGHIFAPSFEELMISEEDLMGIARLGLRDINKYSHRSTIVNVDLSSGGWVIPTEYGKVRSVEPVYSVGGGFKYNPKSRCFDGPSMESIALCIKSDWVITKVQVDNVDPIPDSDLLEEQPRNHNYLDQHLEPANLQPVYEILGYECDTIHREDHDKLMSAHFMMVLGRSRETFELNDSIASSGGQSLYDQGKELRDSAFEDLIVDSDQFMGILDDPEVR